MEKIDGGGEGLDRKQAMQMMRRTLLIRNKLLLQTPVWFLVLSSELFSQLLTADILPSCFSPASSTW